MVTEEMLHAKISRLTSEQREQVYRLIQDVIEPETKVEPRGALLGLFDIRIDAPADYAEKFETYVDGGNDAADIC